eukprot:CAMPEP_0195083442 /NCGR_PEP_ID=MMETSP0448-20130528/24382_1 /TAXON_ID=66468 /ORGANISM="Heterocapsa triquestra, Strain CCMP 448" /LENGTH=298 /DNA_ID=CAMNT_0040116649 /DNA_START=41 /DNA_END=937 /DNA_ORIENTATION=-
MQAVVANLVQSSIAASKAAKNASQELAKEGRKEVARIMFAIFDRVDTNGDKKLSPEEIQLVFDDDDTFKQILEDLNLPKACLTPEYLVALFDFDGDGFVDYSEMVHGICRMNDDLQPRDYVLLDLRVRFMLGRVRHIGNRIEELAQKVEDLREYLEDALTAVTYWKDTRVNTELRWKAVTRLRAAPPEYAPPQLHAPPPKEPEPPTDEVAAFMTFSRRQFAGKQSQLVEEEVTQLPPCPGMPFDGQVMAAVCGKAVLPDAPEPGACGLAVGPDRSLDDKYRRGVAPNPNVTKLKELLS